MTEPALDADPFDAAPPHNLDAEMAILGAMLLNRSTIEPIAAILAGPADFWTLRHQTIYRTITDLYAASRDPKIDPITVAAELLAAGELAKIGGAPYLHQLANSVPSASNATYYADIVREHAQLRAVLEATRRATQRALTAASSAAEILDAAMADLQAAAQAPAPQTSNLPSPNAGWTSSSNSKPAPTPAPSTPPGWTSTRSSSSSPASSSPSAPPPAAASPSSA